MDKDVSRVLHIFLCCASKSRDLCREECGGNLGAKFFHPHIQPNEYIYPLKRTPPSHRKFIYIYIVCKDFDLPSHCAWGAVSAKGCLGARSDVECTRVKWGKCAQTMSPSPTAKKKCPESWHIVWEVGYSGRASNEHQLNTHSFILSAMAFCFFFVVVPFHTPTISDWYWYSTTKREVKFNIFNQTQEKKNTWKKKNRRIVYLVGVWGCCAHHLGAFFQTIHCRNATATFRDRERERVRETGRTRGPDVKFASSYY